MFNQHQISLEKSEQVLYLFTAELDAPLNLALNIFENISEDILLDWTQDYLSRNRISFIGSQLRIIYNNTIIRVLHFPEHLKLYRPVCKDKILPFRKKSDVNKKAEPNVSAPTSIHE